jgi:hypothetical protein
VADAARRATVEAEDELVEVGRQVLGPYRSPVGREQPPLGEAEDQAGRRQMWRRRNREARGCPQTSIALMIPVAPSLTTRSGSPSPRTCTRMSWKNAETVSASSFEPAIRWRSTLRPSKVKPQAARTGSRRGNLHVRF